MRRTGSRFSVNAMSAISTKGRMRFLVFAESFTAEVMCRFLDRLADHFHRKIHLVVDGHSTHRSRKVRNWLAARPDDIELHFLPPYPPELNRDELAAATSSTACPHSAGPGITPNSPRRPAASSGSASVNHTSSAATSTARTSAAS